MTFPADRSHVPADDLDEAAVELTGSFDDLGTDERVELEREARRGLRRVPGITTELEDVSEVEYRQLRLERVVLIGVWTSGTLEEAETSLQELKALAETAGSQVLEGVVQRRDRPDPATYIGSGKARELRDIVVASGDRKSVV